MQDRYRSVTVQQAMGHVVEECGEACQAIGKAQRWGLDSRNPELGDSTSETNSEWIERELVDLIEAAMELRRFLHLRYVERNYSGI